MMMKGPSVTVLLLLACCSAVALSASMSPAEFLRHLAQDGSETICEYLASGAVLNSGSATRALSPSEIFPFALPGEGWKIEVGGWGRMAWFSREDQDHVLADSVVGGVLVKNGVWQFLQLNVTAGSQIQTQTRSPIPISAMSFNIRYGTANDGSNSWYNRDYLVFKVFNDYKAHFVGVQEALLFQLEEISDSVPGYKWIGVGRDNGANAGEFSAIFYQADLFEVVEQGTFWYCNNPTVPGCTSYGNTLPRICTWGKFVYKPTGNTLYFYNTHLDHQSVNSREKSSQQLIDFIYSRANGEAHFITGDFNNAAEGAKEITTIKGSGFDDSFRVLYPNATNVGTFHGFGGNNAGTKIDFLFSPVDPRVGGGPETKVVGAKIIADNENGRYPSDHFPVYAEVVVQL